MGVSPGTIPKRPAQCCCQLGVVPLELVPRVDAVIHVGADGGVKPGLAALRPVLVSVLHHVDIPAVHAAVVRPLVTGPYGPPLTLREAHIHDGVTKLVNQDVLVGVVAVLYHGQVLLPNDVRGSSGVPPRPRVVLSMSRPPDAYLR
eukprot:CAMPEP_0202909734 /NCGR_PEP_ID=MMETSP1392-20130828/50160_1 /ASSEMBLY_ACC=CAM_ASM_000868 /TAXON_ID=225041 /ORGANISM="Chlamydomonas chlamydogama, Strain SAG 11-48b" /LENGTH=145 /DNA_ID=CAMNT_0049599587 /DNA_START=268 /DNA_END=706 /DNA_ORIENTATION=-